PPRRARRVQSALGLHSLLRPTLRHARTLRAPRVVHTLERRGRRRAHTGRRATVTALRALRDRRVPRGGGRTNTCRRPAPARATLARAHALGRLRRTLGPRRLGTLLRERQHAGGLREGKRQKASGKN